MRVDTLRLDHNPRKRPAESRTLYDLLKVGFFLFGFPKNGFVSIDATDDCNLRCKHCYFFAHEEQAENGAYTIEQWVEHFEALKREQLWRFPFLQATWVGGEPLIRRDLIERCKSYFHINTVVTNGTIPLPNWPDVQFYISVDGTEDHHEYMRNQKGIYKRIKKNADRPDLEVSIACCITSQNMHSIESLVREWNEVEGVSKMVFDFYTPIEGIDHDLWMGWEERDRMVDVLLSLKELYGDFISNPEGVLRLMKSDVSRQVTDNCLFTRKATAFGPKGEVKEKCMLGPKADCDRCGCVVPFYMHSLANKKFIIEDNIREFRRVLGRFGSRRAAAGR